MLLWFDRMENRKQSSPTDQQLRCDLTSLMLATMWVVPKNPASFLGRTCCKESDSFCLLACLASWNKADHSYPPSQFSCSHGNEWHCGFLDSDQLVPATTLSLPIRMLQKEASTSPRNSVATQSLRKYRSSSHLGNVQERTNNLHLYQPCSTHHCTINESNQFTRISQFWGGSASNPVCKACCFNSQVFLTLPLRYAWCLPEDIVSNLLHQQYMYNGCTFPKFKLGSRISRSMLVCNCAVMWKRLAWRASAFIVFDPTAVYTLSRQYSNPRDIQQKRRVIERTKDTTQCNLCQAELLIGFLSHWQ